MKMRLRRSEEAETMLGYTASASAVGWRAI
jgi:hypothetical protein